MLSCEICGMEMMLEEDMRTHILLSHLENDLSCPLCCLSGVSYDELCFHITSAHPEEQHRQKEPARLTCASGATARTNSGVHESGKSCTNGDSRTTPGATSTAASAVNAISVVPGSWPEETAPSSAALTAQGPKTMQGSVSCWREGANGINSEHNKAELELLPLSKRGKYTHSNPILTLKANI